MMMTMMHYTPERPAGRRRPLFRAGLALLGLGLLAAPVAAQSGARVQFEKLEIDLGKVTAFDELDTVFVYTNTGTEDLVIEEVNPECGCTTAEFDALVPPGATGQIQARLSTFGLLEGPVTKRIGVISNGTDRPQTILTLRAEIVKWVAGKGRNYFKFELYEGQEASGEIPFVPVYTDEPLTLTRVEAFQPFLETALDRRHDRETVLKLRVKPTAPVGHYDGELTVSTGYTRYPWFKVPVYVTVRSMLQTTPDQVVFRNRRSNPSPKIVRSVNVLWPFRTEYKVTGGQSSVPGLLIAVRELVKGRSYAVQLTWEGDFPPDAEGSLTVETTDPRNPFVDVPIRFEIK